MIASFGVAFAVFVALFATAIVVATTAGQQRVDAREPRLAAPDAAAPLVGRRIELSIDDEQVTQVVLAAVHADAAIPPGLPRVPLPGEAFVSPALADVLDDLPEDSSTFRAVTGNGRIVGFVDPVGLRDPSELFIYVGRQAAALDDQSAPVFGFGRDSADKVSVAPLIVELVTILSGPLVAFLLTATRLAEDLRARRWAALHLVAVPRTVMKTIARTEGGIIGSCGALIGIASYQLLAGAAGRSGLLGVHWFSDDTGLSAMTAAALCGAVTIVAGTLSARAVSAQRPRSPRVRRPAPTRRAWQLVPFIFGIATLSSLTALRMTGHIVASKNALLIAGVVGAIGGLPVAIRPLTTGTCGLIARRARRPFVRLGARRAQYAPGPVVRVVGGAALLIAVAGLGSGMLHDLELSAGAGWDQVQITVEATDVQSHERADVLAVDSIGSYLSLVSEPDATSPTGYEIVVATCAQLTSIATLRECQDGTTFRLVSDDQSLAPPVGAALTLTTETGLQTVVAPDNSIYVAWGAPIPTDALLVTARDLNGSVPSQATITLHVHDGRVDDTKAAIALASATARPSDNRDLARISDAARQHRVLRVALAGAVFLSAAVLVISTLDQQIERRRNIAALLALGVERKTIRRSQLVQVAASLAIAMVLATIVGGLAAQTFLQVGGLSTGWYLASIPSTFGTAVLVALAALLASSIVPVPKHLTEQLRQA